MNTPPPVNRTFKRNSQTGPTQASTLRIPSLSSQKPQVEESGVSRTPPASTQHRAAHQLEEMSGTREIHKGTSEEQGPGKPIEPDKA